MIKTINFVCLLFLSTFCCTSQQVAKYNPATMANQSAQVKHAQINVISIKESRCRLFDSVHRQQEYQQVIDLNKVKIHCLDEQIKELKATLGEMNDAWIAVYKVNKNDTSVETGPKYLNEIEDSRCPIMENIDKAIASKALLQGELDVLQSHKVELDDLYQELDSSLQQQATDKITSVISAFMVEKKKNSLQAIEERRKSNAETIAMKKEENLTRRYIANEQQQALQLLAKEQADQKLQVERERKEQQRQKNLEDKAKKAAHTLKIAQEKKEQQKKHRSYQRMLVVQKKEQDLAQKKIAQKKDEENTKILDQKSQESIAAAIATMEDDNSDLKFQDVVEREYTNFCVKYQVNQKKTKFVQKQLNNNGNSALVEEADFSEITTTRILHLFEIYANIICNESIEDHQVAALNDLSVSLLECDAFLKLEDNCIYSFLQQCPELKLQIDNRYEVLDKKVIMTLEEAQEMELIPKNKIKGLEASISVLELLLQQEKIKIDKDKDEIRRLLGCIVKDKQEKSVLEESCKIYQRVGRKSSVFKCMKVLKKFFDDSCES